MQTENHLIFYQFDGKFLLVVFVFVDSFAVFPIPLPSRQETAFLSWTQLHIVANQLERVQDFKKK